MLVTLGLKNVQEIAIPRATNASNKATSTIEGATLKATSNIEGKLAQN